MQRIITYHCHLSRYTDATTDGSSWQSGSGDRPSKDPADCTFFVPAHAQTRGAKNARGCYRNFTLYLYRSKGPALTCAFPVSLVLYVFMYVLFALIADHTRPTQHPHESPCFLLLSFTCNIQSASTVGSHDPRTTGSHRRQAAMAHICFLLFALFSSLLLLLAGVCSPPSCSCP